MIVKLLGDRATEEQDWKTYQDAEDLSEDIKQHLQKALKEATDATDV
jgi:hypothetical protein